MKTVEETRREIFEAKMLAAFTKENCGSLHTAFNRDADGRYYRNYVYSAWLGFNAALDAVVIELPKLSDQYVEDHYNWSACELKCRAAIESTNLGLKIR